MLAILAHVTPNEYPAGLAMFLAGMGAGIGLSIAAFWGYLRSRK
jgi:hypothetical protein